MKKEISQDDANLKGIEEEYMIEKCNNKEYRPKPLKMVPARIEP